MAEEGHKGEGFKEDKMRMKTTNRIKGQRGNI